MLKLLNLKRNSWHCTSLYTIAYLKIKSSLINISKRSTIVTGAGEPTAEELVEAKKEEESEKKEESKKEETAEEKDIKGIPEFWLNAIKHHPDFGSMTTERDEEALKHLVDLKVAQVENEPVQKNVVFFLTAFFFSTVSLSNFTLAIMNSLKTNLSKRLTF
jgi:hypothetical protein